MSKEIESVSTALFDKIRSRFPGITLGDEKAKACTDPSKARFFNFTYTGEDGAQFGKVTISLIDETSLKIYFGQNISGEMDRDQRQEWYLFLRNLRQFAKRNLLTFDTRDINKSNLQLQDIKQQAKTDDVADVNDVDNQMMESKLYGSSMQSYAECDNTRLRIIHHSQVNDDKHGDRARKIKEIFIETSKGERFLLPHKNLHGARAMARHLNEGGSMYDEIGECINNMVAEMSSMSHFVRSTKRRQFEDAETSDMAHSATQHYLHLKNTLRHLANKKHYQEFVDSYQPEAQMEGEIDEEALRERFVKKIYDDRFNEALPIVYKAYKKYKAESAQNLGNELEEWADDVTTESVWDAAPSEFEVNFKDLQEKLNTPWHTGIDGIDAITDLKHIFPGKDLTKLINDIQRYGKSQGADFDVRGLVKTWIRDNVPSISEKIKIGKDNADDAQTNWEAPTSPELAHPNDQYGASTMDDPVTDPNVKLREHDDLDFIRSLAGIRK